MTSKEALENVKIAPSFMGGNPRYWAYSESSIPFLEDINTIKKDLEVLKILRKHSTRLDDEDWNSNIFNGIDYENLNEEERKVIKEWLEDE